MDFSRGNISNGTGRRWVVSAVRSGKMLICAVPETWLNAQSPPEKAIGQGVHLQVKSSFQLRQEVEGSLRKETEDNRVCLVRNEYSRGHTSKVLEGESSSMDLGQARGLYNNFRIQASMGTTK